MEVTVTRIFSVLLIFAVSRQNFQDHFEEEQETLVEVGLLEPEDPR